MRTSAVSLCDIKEIFQPSLTFIEFVIEDINQFQLVALCSISICLIETSRDSFGAMGVVKEKTQQVKSPGEAPFTKSFERVGKSFEVFLSEARYFGQHMAS